MPWSGIAYHDSNQLCLFPSSFWILPFTNRNVIISPSLSIGWQTRHTFFHFWIYSMLSFGSNCNRHSCNPCRERMPDIQGKVVLCDVWSFAKSASAESPKFQQDPLFSGWDLWFVELSEALASLVKPSAPLSGSSVVHRLVPSPSHVAYMSHPAHRCAQAVCTITAWPSKLWHILHILGFCADIFWKHIDSWILMLNFCLGQGAGAPIVQLSCHYSRGLKNREDSSLSWNPDSELILNSFNVMFFFCVFVYFVCVRSFKAH